MKNNKISAFTLVELIVVIAILAVLATVAFISFQGYTSSSRDSVRLADLKNISKSFEINRTKGIDFPLPDKKVDITASGTIFQYQGELSQNILNSHLNIFDGGLDPLTGDNYGYAVNSARNKFQIIGFLENQDSVANISINTTFADNSDKYVKSSGDNLVLILDSLNNKIINSDIINTIDVHSNVQTYNFLLKNEIKNGGNEIGATIIGGQFDSCKELLESFPETTSGEYYFPNMGIVYCEMSLHGGGWTAVGNYLDWSAPEKNNYYNIGNYLAEKSNNFLAYVQYNNDSQSGSFVSNVVYNGREQWYLINHNYFGEISNRYTVNNNIKLGYGGYNQDKYLLYGSKYAILRFYQGGMVFRFNNLSGNAEVFNSFLGCITSSYVDTTANYPYGFRNSDTPQIADNTCTASYNDTKIGLLFR